MSEHELVWRRVWIVGGVALLFVVLLLSLLPLKNQPDPIIPFGDKFTHMLAFAALMLWFSALVPRSRYPLLFGFLLGFGGLIEVLQLMSGYRFMEFGDLLADAAGGLIGWGLALAGLNRWCSWIERRLGLA